MIAIEYEMSLQEFFDRSRPQRFVEIEKGSPRAGRRKYFLLTLFLYSCLLAATLGPVMMWLGSGNPLVLSFEVLPVALWWAIYTALSKRRRRKTWEKEVRGQKAMITFEPEGIQCDERLTRMCIPWKEASLLEDGTMLMVMAAAGGSIVVPNRVLSDEHRRQIIEWQKAARPK